MSRIAMTDAEIEAIEARANDSMQRGVCCLCVTAPIESFVCDVCRARSLIDTSNGLVRLADSATDVPALIAEVRRLRGLLNNVVR